MHLKQKRPVKTYFYCIIANDLNANLLIQLVNLGYSVELVDTNKRQVLRQQPNLVQQYQLLLFAPSALQDALFWSEYNFSHKQK